MDEGEGGREGGRGWEGGREGERKGESYVKTENPHTNTHVAQCLISEAHG